VVGVGNELVERLPDQALSANGALNDGARSLAGAEAREPVLLRDPLVRGIEGPFETVLVNLNLKLNTALGEPFGGYRHSGSRTSKFEYSKRDAECRSHAELASQIPEGVLRPIQRRRF